MKTQLIQLAAKTVRLSPALTTGVVTAGRIASRGGEARGWLATKLRNFVIHDVRPYDLCPPGERVEETGAGFRLLLDPREFTTWLIRLDRVHEPSLTRFIRGAVRPGDVVVDVGANFGYFSCLFAVQVGDQGRVHAFEPNPAIRERLQRALALNGLMERVAVNGEALSDRGGESLPLYLGPADNSGHSSLILHPDLDPSHVVRVPTLTFDQYTERYPLARIRFMKMDVEGAEPSVLRGMTRTLRESPPEVIVSEVRGDLLGEGEAELQELLREHGYDAVPLPGAEENVCFLLKRGDRYRENRELLDRTAG